MSLELSFIVFLAGTAVCGLIAKLLRRSTSTAMVNGVVFALLWLSSYPLIIWLTGDPEFSLATLLISMMIGAVATGVISALLNSRSA